MILRLCNTIQSKQNNHVINANEPNSIFLLIVRCVDFSRFSRENVVHSKIGKIKYLINDNQIQNYK